MNLKFLLAVCFLTWVPVLAAQKVKLPKNQPMFDGMIVRCAENGECHWECEFGVDTSTVMVHQNLVVEPSGCAPKPPVNSGTIEIPSYKFYPNNLLQNNIPTLRGHTTEYDLRGGQ